MNKPPAATPSPAESARPAASSFKALAGGTKGKTDGADARFDSPNGLDIDAAGRLFIADSGNHAIRRLVPGGLTLTLAGGTAGYRDGRGAEAQFKNPFGVACRRDGAVVVADTGNHRIRLVLEDGTVTTLAGDGTAGARDGAGATAQFQSPMGVALTALDEIVVADTGNHRLRLIGTDGQVSTLAGAGAGYQDGALTEARFSAPSDVALDPRGRLYVADLRNHAIRVVDRNAGSVRTVAGDGTPGTADGTGGAARFKHPAGLFAEPGGGLLVADTGNARVRRLDASGAVTTLGGAAGAVADVVRGPNGVLYLTDTQGHRIASDQGALGP